MVVQGSFSLQLIDAETQQPLNEYRGPSGTVHYAEAKPNGEYFLRFQVLGDGGATNNNTTATTQKPPDNNNDATMMYFRPSVDGKDLGFYTNLTQEQGARDVGLWTYVNGVGTNQALKFETATDQPPLNVMATNAVNAVNATDVSTEEEDAEDSNSKTEGPPKLYMGNVQVQISKAVFTGNQKRVYTSLPPLTKDETVVAAAAVSISASSRTLMTRSTRAEPLNANISASSLPNIAG